MSAPERHRRRGRRAVTLVAFSAALLVALAAAVASVLAVAGRGGGLPERLGGSGLELPGLGGAREETAWSRRRIDAFEPFRFTPDAEEELLTRGRDGHAHVLYEKSPGGVDAAAARTAGWQNGIRGAAASQGVATSTLSALVLLESGGRPDVIAGGDPEGAVGLAQILPGTATELLGMEVDLPRSRSLTRRIDRDRRRVLTARSLREREAAGRRLPELMNERRRADERFSPRLSLDAAALYLSKAQQRFGRDDLAVTSYHMGMGNLESVIDTYVAPRRPRRTPRGTVESYGLSYARLFFDSSPTRNARTYRLLAGLGDDSRTYLFRLEAARQILRLHAEDRQELLRLERLHLAKASAEEVLRPQSENEPYADAGALRAAYDDGELVPLPLDERRYGFRVDRRMGALAARLREPSSLYRGLRPEALGTLAYIAKETRLAGGGKAPLRVTSTVRDRPYQRELLRTTPEATPAYSLHTTGYALDLAYDARTSRRQKRALVAVLERLRSLRVIDWVYEPAAIHLTVGPDGERMVPLWEGLSAPRR